MTEQVRLGVRGLWLVLPIAVLLAFGAGGAEASLLVLGPIVTYSLPLIAMVAFWWEDWPGTRLGPDLAGWVDTLLIATGAVVLTGVGQALSGGFDLRGMFDPTPGPGHTPTFPATLPLGAAAFVAMLELTLVGERWPLQRLPGTVGGVVGLALSWAVALVLYFALVHGGGPVHGADFGAALVCIGALQVLCFVVWRGWPTARVAARGARLACAHGLVLAGGLLTFALARLFAEPGTVTAAGGCFVAAGLCTGMLLELGGSPVVAAVTALLLAAALYAVLSAAAAAFTFTRADASDWVAHASLNALAVSTILHVGVGRRWPFAQASDVL
jgi:hypothetical protein